MTSNTQEQRQRPFIVITNDDGYQAKGIHELAETAKAFGEVVVVAPELHYSGASHSVSMNVPLRVKNRGEKNGVAYYTVNGTPVDCVKAAKLIVARNRKIDLLLAGINHGQNSAVSVIYSGTVAAALEGAMEHWRSIAFSLDDYAEDADFTTANHFAAIMIQRVLAAKEYPSHVTLNVNIPQLPVNEVKGIKIVSQANGYWNEDLEERVDPHGQPYYWLTGFMEDIEKQPGTCLHELREGYVVAQPVQFDVTAYQYMETLKKIVE